MIEGIFPPIPTPFVNDEISFEKLEYNIYRWNRTGIKGYVVLGSNGENVFLTRNEKLYLISETRKFADSEKIIIAGIATESIKEAIELTNAAREEGADYALVLPPYYYKSKMTETAIETYFTKLADGIKIPLIIYNNPRLTGLEISADVVSKLSWHENIAGLKHSSENISQLTEIVSSVPDDFSTLVGTASVLYPGLMMGASGGILALANIAPRECCELYRFCLEEKYEQALLLQRRLVKANNSVTLKYGIAGLKAAMEMFNYFGGEPRLPMQPLNESEVQDLHSIMINAGLL